jgi:acetyltransferase
MSFDYLFNPKSVAVVGASNNFGKWGFDVISALIVSSGFAELEGESAKLEAEVIKIAKSGGIRFVGPNSFGHFNTSSDISTIFFTSKIKRGEIGLISQSGNLGVYIVRKGSEMGIGFSKFVSSGNEADLRFEDYIEYFNRDEETKVIVAYVEGLREGRYFLKLAKEVAKRKPIVVLKGGTTNAGSKAALSHTASLAGSTEIFDAALKQAGVIKVDEIDELLGVSAALLRQPLPKGRNVGILTGGGGYGVITADACEKLGLKVVSLSKNTIEKLDTILPSRWPRSNPVDTVMAYFTSYSCIKIMLEDENVDVILMVGGIGTAPTMRNQLRDNIPRSM